MIVEKLTEEEWSLYEVLRHPAWCGEFVRQMELELAGMEGEPWIHTDYQYDFLMDYGPQVSLSCARAVGKCLEESQRILDTDTGGYLPVSEWYRRGLSRIPTLKEDFNQGQGSAFVTDNGVKPTLEINTQKGFQNKVTYEHPFMTHNGWTAAKNLQVGDYIAVPRELNYFGDKEIDDLDLAFLAHFIAEGQRGHVTISTTEPEVYAELEQFAYHRNMSIRWVDNITVRFTGPYRLRLTEKYGLRYCYSYEKFVPDEIFTLVRHQIATFLNRLFGDDGWCYINDNSYEIGYATTSERLARDIKHLLLRFGIIASLGFSSNDHKGRWNISIKGIENCKRFLEIGFLVKRKQDALEKICNQSSAVNDTSDILPLPNYREYKIPDTQSGRNSTIRPLGYYPTLYKVRRVLNPDETLEKFQRVRWVKITSIKDIGERHTYSIEVPQDHTLVADDIYSHNTEALVTKIMWHAINGWHDSVLFTVPNRSHLDPVFLGLQKRFRANKFLQWWVDRYSVNSQQFLIKFLNNFTLTCRIAGTSGTGVNVVGLHVPIIMLDESAYYPWGTWLELQPVINDWVPGYQIIVSGVPDGRREKSVCYHCDTNPAFNTHHVSAYQNPRFTKEAEERAIVQYGGRDSEEFKRQVLGEHGTPTYAVFDRELLRLEDYDVPVIRLYGAQLKKDSQLPYRVIINLPAIPRYAETVILGIDLGYTQPTAINALYRLDGHWYFLFRLELHQVSYDTQEKIINRLDTKYNPAYIGMDVGAGGQGKSLYHNFVNKDTYKIKDFAERMVAVEFGGTVVVGKDEEGEDLKERVKQFSVSKLQQMTNNHEICFSTRDGDLITELERITYHRTTSGNVIYKALTPGGSDRGDDHNFAALLCFVMVLFEKYDLQSLRTKRAKLFRSRWIT